VTGVVRAVRQGGLVRLSTRITPRGIVRGAAAGRFPYPRTDGSRLVPWYVPPQRLLLRAENVQLEKSLRRHLRREGWQISVDEAFDQVVSGCADRETTWLTPGVQRVYGELHRRGHAYSVEVWDTEGRLVAGSFGVQAGGIFGSDSMFHTVSHAAKAAAVDLAHRVRAAGGVGVDWQYPSQHGLALGAEVLDRRTFLRLLESAQRGAAPRLATERMPASRLVEPPSYRTPGRT
jgi:leucyl/phenylalanyl-tRNA--protein transferase